MDDEEVPPGEGISHGGADGIYGNSSASKKMKKLIKKALIYEISHFPTADWSVDKPINKHPTFQPIGIQLFAANTQSRSFNITYILAWNSAEERRTTPQKLVR